jgi:hypothetical protein
MELEEEEQPKQAAAKHTVATRISLWIRTSIPLVKAVSIGQVYSDLEPLAGFACQ